MLRRRLPQRCVMALFRAALVEMIGIGRTRGVRRPGAGTTQVDGGAHQTELVAVAGEAEVANPPVAVMPLHGGEAALDAGADDRGGPCA